MSGSGIPLGAQSRKKSLSQGARNPMSKLLECPGLKFKVTDFPREPTSASHLAAEDRVSANRKATDPSWGSDQHHLLTGQSRKEEGP